MFSVPTSTLIEYLFVCSCDVQFLDSLDNEAVLSNWEEEEAED